MVFGSGLKRHLAILAVPLTLSVAGSGMAWAESDHPARKVKGDSPCQSGAFSPLPFSGCKVVPNACDC